MPKIPTPPQLFYLKTLHYDQESHLKKVAECVSFLALHGFIDESALQTAFSRLLTLRTKMFEGQGK